MRTSARIVGIWQTTLCHTATLAVCGESVVCYGHGNRIMAMRATREKAATTATSEEAISDYDRFTDCVRTAAIARCLTVKAYRR